MIGEFEVTISEDDIPFAQKSYMESIAEDSKKFHEEIAQILKSGNSDGDDAQLSEMVKALIGATYEII